MTIAATPKESTLHLHHCTKTQGLHQKHDHWRVAADMTLIMVSVITRPAVQRDTIVQVTGDVKAKLSTTYERCVPLLVEGPVAQSDQHGSPSGDEANSDEQDEMIVSSVYSVLVQGTATTRTSLTTIAAVSTGRTSLRRWERGGVPEMSTKFDGEVPQRCQLASRIPQLLSSARELDLINRLQPKAASETRAIEEIVQLSRDQDVKIKDCVGIIQRVLYSQNSQTHSHTTAIKESLDSKLRDRDDQTISQSDAVLRRMHWLNWDRRRQSSITKDHRTTLADQRIQVEAWQSPVTTPVFRVASATFKRADRWPTSRPSWCALTARNTALTHRLVTAKMREMEDESLSAKRVWTRSWRP